MTSQDSPAPVRMWRKAGEQMSSDLMTPPEVATYLGISRTTVYELLAQKKIPGQLKIGTRYRVSRPKFMREVHGEDRQAS